jgi:hypothetical protein
VIRRQGSDLRVERVEWRAITNAAVIAVVGALLVALALTRAHQPPQYALAGLLALVLLLCCWLVYRPRAVVVVGPREVRWRSGARRWSVPGREVAAARVVPGMWTQLVLLDARGRVLRSVALPYFSPDELRRALAQAGIGGKRPRS